jgi:GDP-L-fucose synthase
MTWLMLAYTSWKVLILKTWSKKNLPTSYLRESKIEIRIPYKYHYGKDLTIAELATLIKKVVGFDGLVSWDTTKPDGTFQKLLSVKKIHELGWQEKTSLDEGIKKVYQEYLQ